MLAIHAKNLAIQKRGRLVLQKVGFHIAKGSLVAIIGPNGSGKSSLLRMLARLEQGLPGSYLQIFGKEDFCIQSLSKVLAYCPTHPRVNFDFEVRHLVGLGTHPLTLSNFARQAKTSEVLEHFDLMSLSKAKLSELSSGEYQQVMLARTIAQDTPLLVLDEPTANLDLRCKSKIFSKLYGLCKSIEKTIVFASHDLDLVKNYADMIIALKKGEVFSQGPTEEVLTPGLLAALFDL